MSKNTTSGKRKGGQSFAKSSKSKKVHLTEDSTEKSDGTHDMANINNLPNELLEKIFSSLEVKQRIRNELVCRRWRWLGTHEQRSWPTELIINVGTYRMGGSAVASLLSRCGRDLKTLEIRRRYRRNVRLGPNALEDTMRAVADHCPNLTEITLTRLCLDTACLKVLGEVSHKLKVLCLRNLNGSAVEGLDEFLLECDELECLDITGNIGETCFRGVRSKLRTLRLTRTYLQANTLNCLTKKCDGLTELCLTSCGSSVMLTLTLEFKMLFDKYKNTLRVLYLDEWSFAPFAANGILWGCVSVLQKLEVLSFDESWGVSDTLINTVIENCMYLEDLCLRHTSVTDIGLYYLRMASCLKVLDVSCNDQITGSGIKFLSELQGLEILYAGYLPLVPQDCFVHFARVCSNLKLLDVRGNTQVTNELVRVLDSRLQRGFLKKAVTVLVGNTVVTANIITCEKLKLDFRVTPFFQHPLRCIRDELNL